MNKKLKKGLLACALLTYIGVPMVVHAQDSDINITVSTNFDKEIAKAEPENKTIISRDDLDRKGARNLADALSGEQDIQFGTDDMGRATISIRGAEPRHTLFLVDGRRLASGLSKFNGATDEIYRLGTDDVDHVEIVRGAAAAKYGSDAMGGVINIVTKIPDKFTFRTNTEVDKIESSGKSQYNDSMTISTGRIGNFKAEATWGRSKTAPFLYGDQEDSMQYYGMRYPFNAKAEIDLDNNMGTIRVEHSKLREKLGKNTELTNQYKKKYDGFTNIYGKLVAKEQAERINNSINWHRSTNKFDYNFKYYNTEMNNDTDFIVVQQIRQLKEDKSLDYISKTIAQPYFDTFKTKKDVYEGNITVLPDDKHILNFAINYTKDHGEGTRISVPGQDRHAIYRTYAWEFDKPEGFHQSNYAPNALPEGMTQISSQAVPKYVNSATISSHSYAISDDYQINDKLLFNTALRYDVNSKFGNHLSPKIGLTYNKTNSLRYKVNLGTGFSTPGIAELYHDWEMYEPSMNELPPFRSGWFFKGNPDLKPEKSLNFDFSIENEKGKTTTKFTVFRNSFRDFMQIVYDGQIPSANLTGFNHYDSNVRYFNPYNSWMSDYDSFEEVKSAIDEAETNKEKRDVALDLDYVKGIEPVDDVYTYKNISKARMQGIEYEVKHSFSKAFSSSLGYTFLDARNSQTNERLEGRGRHLFNLSLQYDDKKHGFRSKLWGTYTRNYLDIRDRYETGVLIDKRDGLKVVPDIIIPNENGTAPVVIFENEKAAKAYANQKDGLYTYTKEKKAKEKNYGVWNIMFEKDFGKHATMYAGVTNLFGAKDQFLNLGGRVYRIGFRTVF